MTNVFIGGICFGKNTPEDFEMNVDKFQDVILVERKYFLDHIGLIKSWAEHCDTCDGDHSKC